MALDRDSARAAAVADTIGLAADKMAGLAAAALDRVAVLAYSQAALDTAAVLVDTIGLAADKALAVALDWIARVADTAFAHLRAWERQLFSRRGEVQLLERFCFLRIWLFDNRASCQMAQEYHQRLC